MIIDTRLQLSSQQALTATAASTNVLDLGAAPAGQIANAPYPRLIGPGSKLFFVIAARVGLAGTSPTLQVAVQTDSSAAFGSPVTVLQSPTLSAFAAGQLLVLPMPFSNKEFLRLYYTLGGTTPTCTVDAWLGDEPFDWTAMPDTLQAP
jgi:hypothetical protein